MTTILFTVLTVLDGYALRYDHEKREEGIFCFFLVVALFIAPFVDFLYYSN